VVDGVRDITRRVDGSPDRQKTNVLGGQLATPGGRCVTYAHIVTGQDGAYLARHGFRVQRR
jgi:hypothetical protein